MHQDRLVAGGLGQGDKFRLARAQGNHLLAAHKAIHERLVDVDLAAAQAFAGGPVVGEIGVGVAFHKVLGDGLVGGQLAAREVHNRLAGGQAEVDTITLGPPKVPNQVLDQLHRLGCWLGRPGGKILDHCLGVRPLVAHIEHLSQHSPVGCGLARVQLLSGVGGEHIVLAAWSGGCFHLGSAGQLKEVVVQPHRGTHRDGTIALDLAPSFEKLELVPGLLVGGSTNSRSARVWPRFGEP